MRLLPCLTAAVLVVTTSSVFAQDSLSAVDLPKACKTSGHSMPMPPMSNQDKQMKDMMAKMGKTQQGLHEAMMKMDPAMMMGMMAEDADVAWICAMIPHHQGAIDMAQAGLLQADDPESKKLAEETIQGQKREIAKLEAWVKEHAKQEAKN
jgi:uncharacterized protein (DUF305 family)